MSLTSIKFFIFIIISSLLVFFSSFKYKRYLIFLASLIFYFSFKGYSSIFVLIFSFSSFYIAKNINKKLLILYVILMVTSILAFRNILFLSKFSPIGISFLSFRILSYLIDVYRGNIAYEKSFFDYLQYILFFPIISAGPIMRYSSFKDGINNLKSDYETYKKGLLLLCLGVFEKVVIVERISTITSTIRTNLNLSSTYFIALIFLYSFEIYFDFDAYSNMARGLGFMLGLDVGQNFKTPYLSRGFNEFFRRWHISLSSWFKDYVYIPLGGSRKNHYINILIVSILSGLWHGFGLNFILWGLFLGIFQIVHKIISKKIKLPNLLLIISTYLGVSFTWVLFFSRDIFEALAIYKRVFLFNFQSLDLNILNTSIHDFTLTISLILGMIVLDIFKSRYDMLEVFSKMNFILRWLFYLGLMVAFLLFARYGIDYNPSDFIYYHF